MEGPTDRWGQELVVGGGGSRRGMCVLCCVMPSCSVLLVLL